MPDVTARLGPGEQTDGRQAAAADASSQAAVGNRLRWVPSMPVLCSLVNGPVTVAWPALIIVLSLLTACMHDPMAQSYTQSTVGASDCAGVRDVPALVQGRFCRVPRGQQGVRAPGAACIPGARGDNSGAGPQR